MESGTGGRNGNRRTGGTGGRNGNRRTGGTGGDAGPTGHLVRTGTWAGLRAGEPVDVTGTRLRGATWTFLAHVRNARSGEEWIEVVGGRDGDRALRSFRPDQVYPIVGRPVRAAGRGRRAATGSPASLAKAPQLPLGPAEGDPAG